MIRDNDYIIKVRKTESSWLAFSPELRLRYRAIAQVGEGATPQEAIAAYFMANAGLYGIRSIHYDMADAVTAAHVTTNSISNTKLL